jgi:membrane-associated phospholipid phosphatase
MPARSYIFTPNALRTSARIAVAAITLMVVAACATDKSGPTDLNSRVGAERSGVPFSEGLASPAWQLTARTLVSQALYSPVNAGHAYPILAVAQYLAVQKAEAAINGEGRVRIESDRGAVAGASAAVLTYLFPASAQALEDSVTAQANAGPGQPHPAFAAGEAIGRAVGAEMVARTIGDGFSIFSNPAPPVGPGFWTTNAPGLPVAGGQFPGIRPWFLTSASQFRPAAPPAFGSAAFNAGRDEIEHITAVGTRTPEQVAIAVKWALNPGTPTASGFWLGFASDQIAARGLSERDATHVFALLSSTMADATVGCWDAKMTYWLVRPWQTDAAINTIALVGRPNHPSYPSGHSCVSASAGAVISSFFPDLTNQLNGMVTEAGLSRMYAGIHYRFDIDAGQALGRNVAAFTIAADRSGNSVLTAH